MQKLSRREIVRHVVHDALSKEVGGTIYELSQILKWTYINGITYFFLENKTVILV